MHSNSVLPCGRAVAGLFELFQRFDLERVAQANDATVDHPCGDPAMAAHRLEGAKAQALFQLGARLAPAGGFQNRLADTKASAFEAEQVDAADGDIAPEILGLYPMLSIAAEQSADHGQVFPLDQRDLARVAWAGARMIAGQACFATGLDRIENQHVAESFGAHANPAHLAALWHGSDKGLERAGRVLVRLQGMVL